MTDEINITGTPGTTPFGTAGDRANAGWMNQNYNAQQAFQRRQIMAAQKAAANAAKMANTAYSNDYTMAHRENADFNARARAQQVAERAARAAQASEGMSRLRNWSGSQIAAQKASATAYRNDYTMAGRENAAYDANARAHYRGSQAYFSTQEMSRLGSRGASAVNNNDLRELIRIDKHLSKMDTNLDKFVKSNGMTSQEREAAKKQARETLSASFSKISAAAEGAPGIKGALMRAIVRSRGAGGGGNGYNGGGGGASGGPGLGLGSKAAMALFAGMEGMEALAGPVGWGIAAASAAYEIPNAVAGAFSHTYQSALPYYNLNRGAGRMGIAGGFNGQDIVKGLYPGGGKVPQWMTDLGMDPASAMSMMQNYGIAPTSAGGAIDKMQYLGGLSYRTGLAGMSDSDLNGMARGQALNGLDQGKSLADFQKIMATAVATGSDRSMVLRSILGATAAVAATGGQFGATTGMGGLANTLMNSGLAGGKTGASLASVSAGLSNTLNSLGSDPVSSMPMYRYLATKGGAKATASAAFSPSVYASLQKTPAGQRLIQDFNTAPSLSLKMMYLGQAMNGDQSFASSIYQQYGGAGGNSAVQDAFLANQGGFSLGNAIGLNSGASSSGGNIGVGTIGSGTPAVMAAIQAAAKATGIDPNVLTGVFGGESSMGALLGTKGDNGGGLGQMNPGALKAVGMSGANMKDPTTAAIASAKYMQKMYGLFGSVSDPNQRLTDAFEAYNWGPGHAADILAGNVPAQYQYNAAQKTAWMQGAQFQGNMGLATSGNAFGAGTGQAGMIAAQQAAGGAGALLSSLQNGTLKISADTMNVTTMVVSHVINAGQTAPFAPRTFSHPRQP